jgi:hypothetical protein
MTFAAAKKKMARIRRTFVAAVLWLFVLIAGFARDALERAAPPRDS